MVNHRWPNGVVCPTCGRTDVSFLATQKKWQCKSAHAKRQFSVKVGTIVSENDRSSLRRGAVGLWSHLPREIRSFQNHAVCWIETPAPYDARRNTTRKLAPRPERLCSSMDPPSVCRMVWQIARPMPRPSPLVVKKGWKSLALRSSGTPGP